ncbi:MAG: cupin fold metalloprotein, WbuC family [Geobacter sp.]|nr:MAG: cupin fold metalloprotein, WbuC family [Geobacter sp.]
MKLVTSDLVRELSGQALLSPRLRKNHNLHPRDDSRCHRLLNAVEPASYIRPHRHLDPEKDEAFILMSGRLGVITFSDSGEVVEAVALSHAGGNLAADIPSGVYHCAVSLEPGTVFYEAKAGPYLPLAEEEKATWAPAEDDPAAPAFLELLRTIFE